MRTVIDFFSTMYFLARMWISQDEGYDYWADEQLVLNVNFNPTKQEN